MKFTRYYVVGVAICLVFSSFIYIWNAALADKGRKYYEQTGQILWDIYTEENVVALTFDDGPHPKYTKEVLDLLVQYEAKATFFVVGEHAEKNYDLIARMYEEQHEIANHTYTHPFKASVPKLLKEIKQTNDTIFSITGSYPNLFRPVEGQYTDALIDAVSKQGYTVVMWSWHQDTEDWKDPGVKRIVNKVLKGTKKGDVILFHDGGGNRQQTVKALEEILPALKNDGFRFVTVSEMLAIREKNKKGDVVK